MPGRRSDSAYSCSMCNEDVKSGKDLECDMCVRWYHKIYLRSKVEISQTSTRPTRMTMAWYCGGFRHIKGRTIAARQQLNEFKADDAKKITKMQSKMDRLVNTGSN